MFLWSLVLLCSCHNLISSYSVTHTYPSGNHSSLNGLQNYSNYSSLNISIRDDVSLCKRIVIANSSHLAITGTQQLPSAITCCGNDSGFSFSNVSNLMLHKLEFVECSILVNSTSAIRADNSTWLLRTAIHIAISSNISITEVNVMDSNGLGIAIIDSGGNITINNCMFERNSIQANSLQEYSGYSGGGLHIELQKYTLSGSTSHSLDTSYSIENCFFNDNSAIVTNFKQNEFEWKRSYRYLEAGGGIFIGINENVIDIIFSIRNCTFENNTASWGGGITALVIGKVSSTSIILFNCTLDHNSSPNYGGGGVYVVHNVTGRDNNLILFEKCNFFNNFAGFGGGLQFIGESPTSGLNRTLVHFLNCVFQGNQANVSAAVDVMQITPQSSIEGLTILFTSCNFSDNAVIDSTEPIGNSSAFQFKSGTGTLTIFHQNITFEGPILFESNTGTALYVIAANIEFRTGTRVKFIDNSGYNGGAIALMSSSFMSIEPNSTFFFIGNTAIDKGGAIFVSNNVALHQLHRIDIISCFITDCQDTAQFFFSENKAGLIYKQNNAIYTDNLAGCEAVCSKYQISLEENEEEAEVIHALSCFGKMYSCDNTCRADLSRHDGMYCTNCSTLGREEVRGLVDRYAIDTSAQILEFPGLEFNYPISAFDELGNWFPRSSFTADIDNENGAYIEVGNRIISNNTIKISGKPSSSTKLILRRFGTYPLNLKTVVKLENCPPGYSLVDDDTCSCRRSRDNQEPWYRGVLCKKEPLIAYGVWIGYIGGHSPENLFTSLCPMGFCSYNNTKKTVSSLHKLPRRPSDLERYICAPGRRGHLCGVCVRNSSVYFHSPQYTCKENSNCRQGFLYYFASELIPVTMVYVFIILLNISFTSGIANGFIFFAQVIDSLAINANGINGLNPADEAFTVFTQAYKCIYNSFNLEFFEIDEFSFCLWEGAGTLDVMAIKYVTMFYAFLLILLTVLIMNRCANCCKCPCKPEKSLKKSIIHGLSAFLVLCYVQCMRVTFRILTPTFPEGHGIKYSNYTVVYFSGNLDYFRGEHLRYALPALLCMVFIIILPPLVLLIYPLYLKMFSLCGLAESKIVKSLSTPFAKAVPLIDAFQSCYKDKFRFVAGLFFVYRAFILLSFLIAIGYGQFYSAVSIQLVLMLIFHSVAQPYNNNCHNIIDILIFSNLLIINTMSLYRFGQSYHKDFTSMKHIKYAGIVQLVLVYLPVLAAVSYVIAKIVLVVKKRVTKRSYRLEEDIENSYSYRSFRLASFN